MNSWRIKFGLAILFFWSAMVMFGGLLVETVLLYPNIFHDVPASLERSSEFMVASNPGSYFPQLGAITLGSAVLAIIATWRQPFVRYTFLGGFLSIALGDFLLSMLAMWERNTIMFEEGLAKHSAEYLQQVAADFQVAHWFRVAAAGLAAALVFVGLLRLHREWLSKKPTAPAADRNSSSPKPPTGDPLAVNAAAQVQAHSSVHRRW